jgi:hypothetical protein
LKRPHSTHTFQEFITYTVVFAEIVFWFFVGEQIGRWNRFGYLVPSSFVDPVRPVNY